MEIINTTDGYKLGHHRMYPEGTEMVYSNWTPRSNKYFPEATEGSVVFGIQYLIKEYFIKRFNENFFNLPREQAINMFYKRINNFVGIDTVGIEHIEALYDLGYLPIRIKALPEGTICPVRVPMMTIVNTDPRFFWLTNYLETIISCTLWMPCTSATKARLYKKELVRHANTTGFPENIALGFLCHDFSMRGIGELEVLKKTYPDCKFKLVVYHAVNQEGLDKVCSAFDEVIITNSYKNYESKGNLTVIDVTAG